MKSIKIFGREIVSYGVRDDTSSRINRSLKKALDVSNRDYTKQANLKTLRKVVLREALLYKGILKKNKDTVRNWFVVKPIKDGSKVPQNVLDALDDFDRRTNFKYKLYQTGVCANIYGTGYLERTYVENTKKLDSPVSPKSEPLNLIVQNPECIYSIGAHDKKKDGKDYFVYRKEATTEDVYIHTDRLQKLCIDKLPFSKFGISKVNVLYNVLRSKMNADISSGEILNWFGHGILHMTIDNMNDEQEQSALKLMAEHKDYFVTDETFKMDVHNPTQINPAPFYDYFYTNIAAAMEMPTHMLTGNTPGDVTGSEVGVSEYYHDIENIQDVIFTPIIEKFYKQLLKARGLKWKYRIQWNPIFVDELSEAKILQTRSFSAVQNKNSNIISVEEARGVLNEGVVNLDVDKVPEQPAPVLPGKPTGTEPNIAPQPTVKPKGDDKTINKGVKIYEITPSQEKMLLSQMKADGIREMKEQDLRLEEAKNGKKVKRRKKTNKRKTKKA